LPLHTDFPDSLAGVDLNDLALNAPVVNFPHDFERAVGADRCAALGDFLRQLDDFPAFDAGGLAVLETGQEIAVESLPVLVPGPLFLLGVLFDVPLRQLAEGIGGTLAHSGGG